MKADASETRNTGVSPLMKRERTRTRNKYHTEKWIMQKYRQLRNFLSIPWHSFVIPSTHTALPVWLGWLTVNHRHTFGRLWRFPGYGSAH